MTGLDLVAVQDIIADHIRDSFPGYEVKEDSVLDNEMLVKNDNKVRPFIMLRWHGLIHSTTNGSFGGVRHDEYNSAVDIMVVAPTPRQGRRALNMIMDELIGWQVPGGSPLVPSGGEAVFPLTEYGASPPIYLAINTLTFQVNSDGVAEYIGS